VILQRYHVRQHSETIYASSDTDKVSHIDGAGDVDNGRAWRTVRRPSDMVRKSTRWPRERADIWPQNEYAKQIREYHSQEKPGKSHGKVFFRGKWLESMKLPASHCKHSQWFM
jgi:hypothetical protein